MLKKIYFLVDEEVQEDMSDLLLKVKPGDIIDIEEIGYIFRSQASWDLTDANVISSAYGIKLKELDGGKVLIKDKWEV